jgi:hypothetical protein
VLVALHLAAVKGIFAGSMIGRYVLNQISPGHGSFLCLEDLGWFIVRLAYVQH